MEKITFVPVQFNDIGLIYGWRNMPEIRNRMIKTKFIGWTEHTEYWGKRLSNKNYYESYIAYVNENPIGMVRMDLNKIRKDAEVGIIIYPEMQSKGYGSKFLKESLSKLKKSGIDRVYARVRIDNHQSQNMFIKNKFEIMYCRNGYYLLTRVLK